MASETLSEVELLKLKLAVETVARRMAETAVSQAAYEALITALCSAHSIDPRKYTLDMASGEFHPIPEIGT